jgi:hypothetical protein
VGKLAACVHDVTSFPKNIQRWLKSGGSARRTRYATYLSLVKIDFWRARFFIARSGLDGKPIAFGALINSAIPGGLPCALYSMTVPSVIVEPVRKEPQKKGKFIRFPLSAMASLRRLYENELPTALVASPG